MATGEEEWFNVGRQHEDKMKGVLPGKHRGKHKDDIAGEEAPSLA